MSDLDFDLNAPAAPSLTLDAAPAAPTLTLDPEADAKVVEEAKKATPVTVEDTPLSPEEQKMVQDFAEKIDLTNSQMILQYGAASQKKLSDFSDSALSRVRTKDMGETVKSKKSKTVRSRRVRTVKSKRRKLYAVSLSCDHKMAEERQKIVAKTIFFINLIHFDCKDNAFFKYKSYFCTAKSK